MALGEVDAFLSHSWSDSAEHKWQELERWAKEFTEKNQKEPVRPLASSPRTVRLGWLPRLRRSLSTGALSTGALSTGALSSLSSAQLLFLDKACIMQNAIDKTLANLPIFVAGCNHMVILAGPSYVTRLWCLLEVFCFWSAR